MTDAIGPQAYGVFAAIIVATDVEEQILIRCIGGFAPLDVYADTQTYFQTCLNRGGRSLRVIYARQDEMGMTAAAALCTKVIERFRPQYLIMCGIAAGTLGKHEDKQLFGDVVVADMVWNYASGKFVPRDRGEITHGDFDFQPRPMVIHQLEGIRDCVEEAIVSPENESYVHIGPIACGNAVVASKVIRDEHVLGQFEETAALDMESYAVAYAAAHAPDPKPTSLIIKGICDYADSHKSDNYQRFAAYTSALFARLLCEKYLPLADEGSR